jgi:hypothetical protein
MNEPLSDSVPDTLLKRRPPRRADSPGDGKIAVAKHASRCTVCSHPERDLIEQLFVDWFSVASIRREFGLRYRTAIYRHAKAFGLFERRARNVRFALGSIIEKIQSIEPTADTVLRAIHALAHINHQGEWVARRSRSPYSELYNEDSIDPLPMQQSSARTSSSASSPANPSNVAPARNSATALPDRSRKSPKISSRISKPAARAKASRGARFDRYTCKTKKRPSH